MSDSPLTECPVCEGAIRRVVNSVGVVFKGKGFYVTDNRNGTASSRAEAKSGKEAGDSKATGEKESGKKENKTAETSASAAT